MPYILLHSWVLVSLVLELLTNDHQYALLAFLPALLCPCSSLGFQNAIRRLQFASSHVIQISLLHTSAVQLPRRMNPTTDEFIKKIRTKIFWILITTSTYNYRTETIFASIKSPDQWLSIGAKIVSVR